MTEGEVIEQLVQHTSLLILGISVFFTMLSVYLAGLNYVLSEESFATRVIAFSFMSLCLLMLLTVMFGVQSQHAGLIERLLDIGRAGELTSAGRAFVHNATGQTAFVPGLRLTIDDAVLYLAWSVMFFVYLALIHLTFFYKWRPPAQLRGLP